MPRSSFLVSLLGGAAAAGLLLLPGAALAGSAAASLERVATLHVPGLPLMVFDIGYVNRQGIYALADRSNGGLDFFDAATDKYLGRAVGFAGFNKATGGKVLFVPIRADASLADCTRGCIAVFAPHGG